MLGKRAIKIQSTLSLAVVLAASVIGLLPEEALAQYVDILGAPTQSSSLRSPLIPGAPNALPGQAPGIGQPPPPGDGPAPLPVHPGDLGAPALPPTGGADPTHGNIFPTRSGVAPKPPGPYVPGAGRIPTEAGWQQGMFENGAGNGGTFWGPGGPSGGTGRFDDGGARPAASGMGPGGTNGGTFWGPGGPNGGTFWGPGGPSSGTGTFDNGGARGSASGMGPGGPNGGTFWGPGGASSGSGTFDNGGARASAAGMGPGGPNGGTFWGPGGASSGTGTLDNGGARGSAAGTLETGAGSGGTSTFENGAGNGGTGRFDDGGSRAGAAGTTQNANARGSQPSRYDFNGVLPTVRTFSRYLVILGVVVGTVFVAMASWGMVFGNAHAGSRVIGAVGGMMLLLAGYTIWKIVQMNTFDANSTGWWSRYQNGQPQVINGPNGQPAQQSGPYSGAQRP